MIGASIGIVSLVGFLVAGAASFFFLTQALRTLPVGVAYAVWTGIGAAGTAIIGMYFLGESRDTLKFVSLALLIGGIIGLRLTGEHLRREVGSRKCEVGSISLT